MDELRSKFDETQKMVSDLEESLQQLSNIFPMDINFRITQLRTAISKAHTKKASFLDEFEPKVQIPDFTDQKYFDDLSEQTAQEIREHFDEISEYQDTHFNKFIREHPGPYYSTEEEAQNFPIKRLEKLRSLIQQDKDNVNSKLNNLTQKVSFINSSNSGEEELQIKPIKDSINYQEMQLSDVINQMQEVQMMIEIQKNRQSKTSDVVVDNSKVSPAEKQLQEAFEEYKRLDDSIGREVSLYNTMSNSLMSDLDEIKANLTGISLKEQSIDSVIQKVNPILEKAKIKGESLEESFDKFSMRVNKAKEEKGKNKEPDEFIALKEKCDKYQQEDQKQLDATKSLVEEITQQIEALTFQ